MTTYNEVTAADTDVALFLVNQLHAINIRRLPLKAWVARQDGAIVAVLTFQNITYPAIHLHISDTVKRPFMRLVKLWLLAHDWFRDNKFPIIAAPVHQYLYHHRHLMTKLGFEKIGEERDLKGELMETIYGYDFTKERA